MGEAHGAWEPDEELLSQTVEVLRASQSHSNETQCAVQEALRRYNQDPEFNRYLLYVLVSQADSEEVAAIAGLLLKNNIRLMFHVMPADIVEDVKSACLQSIGVSSKLLRATNGVIITTIASLQGISSWPGLMESLCEAIDTDDADLVLGAFSVLEKVCEDSSQDLVKTMPHDLVETILPKLMAFVGHGEPTVRMYALSCLCPFVSEQDINDPDRPEQFLQPLLDGLYSLTEDPDEDVRKNVVKALVLVYEHHPELTADNLENLIQFMVAMTADASADVQQEACEFWIAADGDENVAHGLEPHLPELVPILVQHTRYTDHDIVLLGGDDDSHVPDHPKDIRPHIVRGRAGVEDDDDDDDDDADDLLSEWGLRKAAAAALDVMATMFGDKSVLPESRYVDILLSTLDGVLGSDEWEVVESGILVLGAIAQGCKGKMADYMAKLLTFLLDCLSHERSLVRNITCFTIARYKDWIMLPENAALEATLEHLLRCVADGSKVVQQAACTALCTFFEQDRAGELLEPFLEPIVHQLVIAAHGAYQRKSLICVYDAINTLAERVGERLKPQPLSEQLMPCLLEQWMNYTDTDPEQFALMECLTSVVVAVGDGGLSYSPVIHEKCMRMLETAAERDELAKRGELHGGDPDPEFIVCAVDLLSSSAEALGPSVESLVGDSRIIELIVCLSRSEHLDVRQSVYALIGDYSKACFPHLESAVHDLIGTLALSLNPRYVAVCNNAAWALGEIAMQLGENMRYCLDRVVPGLTSILAGEHGTPLMRATVAVALGRLGMVCPVTLGEHIHPVFGSWCDAIMPFKNNDEKQDAFLGLCNMVITNPEAYASKLGFLIPAVCSFADEDYHHYPDLHQQVTGIMQYYKEQLGDEWDMYLQHIPEAMADIRVRLTTTFEC